jgi:hypothetical protein
MCTVAAALGAASVQVWEIMSRGWAHKGGDRWRSVLVLPTHSSLHHGYQDQASVPGGADPSR